MAKRTRTARPKTPEEAAAAFASFNEICTVRIELLDTNPLIWREAEVPTSITMKVLHDVVQITMGWFDSHLWRFTVNGQHIGPVLDEPWANPDQKDAMKVRLRDILGPDTTVIDYLYDFGDSWEHRLTVSDVRQGEPGVDYPRYIAGEWAAPPEDCGGILGFYAVLDALADPKHPDHADVAEWLDGYDPREIKELPMMYALLRIANQRNAARVRLSKAKG